MSNTLFIDGFIFGEKNFGGVARMWSEIIPQLQRRIFPITLLMPVKNLLSHQEKLLLNEINIIYDYFYWPKRIFSKSDIRNYLLTRLYKASKASIFHSTYYTTIDSPNTKNVVTIYDMIYEIFESQSSSKWEKQVLYNKQNCIKAADKIVCISENTKKDLIRFYPEIPECKISVIYLGNSYLSGLDTIEFADVTSRSHNAQLQSQDYFLVVGKLDGYKNFQLILNLIKQQPLAKNFKFVCVGSEKNSPCRINAERDFSDNFVFLDYVSNQDLATYYRNAIGLVYPSLYEGFGLPILEAMNNLCPVICSNSSSLPEVGGDAALYFDPQSTDELFKRLMDVLSCDREKIIAKGLANCARFSWELTTKELINLYQELI